MAGTFCPNVQCMYSQRPVRIIRLDESVLHLVSNNLESSLLSDLSKELHLDLERLLVRRNNKNKCFQYKIFTIKIRNNVFGSFVKHTNNCAVKVPLCSISIGIMQTRLVNPYHFGPFWTSHWPLKICIYVHIQRFSDLPEGSGSTIFSIKPGNSLNPKLLMININMGLKKFSVKAGIPLMIPVNPKITVHCIKASLMGTYQSKKFFNIFSVFLNNSIVS